MPRARRNLAVLAVAATTALVPAGCGGGGAKSDEAKVKDTVHDFLAAAANGDGGKACGLTDDAGRKQLEGAARGKLTCEQIVQRLGQRLPRNLKTALENAEVKKVTIKGDHATIQDTDITSSKGNLQGFLQSGTPTQLAKHGGDWKLTGD